VFKASSNYREARGLQSDEVAFTNSCCYVDSEMSLCVEEKGESPSILQGVLSSMGANCK
jgi:hypothetical protein